jgi:hypothetical protein
MRRAAMAIDPEILARLIRSRCADEIDDDQFEQIKRGLGLARADQDEPEDDDEDVENEVRWLIIDVCNALDAKMTRLERMLAALGVNPARCCHGNLALAERSQ